MCVFEVLKFLFRFWWVFAACTISVKFYFRLCGILGKYLFPNLTQKPQAQHKSPKPKPNAQAQHKSPTQKHKHKSPTQKPNTDMDTSNVLRFTSENIRRFENMEVKLQWLEQCFFPPPMPLSRGMRMIGLQPRRYFGYSVPSSTSMQILHEYMDSDTEVVEIGSGLGLYAFVFGDRRFCKRWIATDHPGKYMQWLPEGTRHPYAPVCLTEFPLDLFHRNTPKEKRVLLTIWPEPNSTYFWDDYVTKFDGDTIILIGTPGVTGKEEMWGWISRAFPKSFKCTTVCKISLGAIFDYESIYVWQRGAALLKR